MDHVLLSFLCWTQFEFQQNQKMFTWYCLFGPICMELRPEGLNPPPLNNRISQYSKKNPSCKGPPLFACSSSPKVKTLLDTIFSQNRFFSTETDGNLSLSSLLFLTFIGDAERQTPNFSSSCVPHSLVPDPFPAFGFPWFCRLFFPPLSLC